MDDVTNKKSKVNEWYEYNQYNDIYTTTISLKSKTNPSLVWMENNKLHLEAKKISGL